MEHEAFAKFYRDEFGRILASVIRSIGDFELAEDAVQEAFAAALEQWPRDGMPDNPRAWIVGVARNKAIDRMRRQSRFAERSDEVRRMIEAEHASATPPMSDSAVPDERLSLIFTCCHPALAQEAQIALSLRTLCGLSTDQIARLFLVPPVTMAQRLVRAKRKIAASKIPYETPPRERLAERLDAVMTVVYLVFTEGYAATAGSELVRRDLAAEAIRLGRILVELMPDEPEPRGLLAMMLLHDARRDARVDDELHAVGTLRGVGEIARILLEGRISGFRSLRSHALAPADAGESLQNSFVGGPVLFQKLAGGVAVGRGNGQEKMFGRDVFVLEAGGFVEGTFQHLVERPAQGLLRKALHLGQAASPGLQNLNTSVGRRIIHEDEFNGFPRLDG